MTQLETNLNFISSLPDDPTITTAELKLEFDKAGNIIKDFINNILESEITANIASCLASAKDYTDSSIGALSFNASAISFNNSGTGMSSTNVQNAIVELKTGINSAIATVDKKTVSGDFTITRHTVFTGVLAPDQDIETAAPVSKAGYYPIAIAGFYNTFTKFVDLYELQLNNRTVGSANISFRIRSTNGIDVISETLVVDVLWVRVR